ncbi:PAS domain S-box protein [Stenotrophomonas maltophilia]|uniref:PAS domain S-box protein n=1 Tax=Stenotrophomonas maltophilia TaxID=40324 RepID=UPI002ED97550
MAGQGTNGNGLLERRLQALAEERRRLAMIIDGTAAGTWEWNVQNGEMRVNARWAEIVGYRLEELEPVCQKTFLKLVHPDDIALSDAALDEHFEGRTDNYACLLRMRHKNGQWIWIQDRGRVFEWDAQGKPLWMAGAHADVTELQQARQDAAETRQRLQAVVDASDEVAVIATDIDGTITLFNTGAQRLLGYSAADVVGQRRLDAFHDPQELNAWLRPLADADGQLPDVFEALSARADGQTYSRQWTLLRKDGQPRQVRLSISRMDGADGVRIGYVGMAIDITEILQARAEARLSAEKFAGAFTSAALGMALVSLEGRWLDVNNALCRILGYPREELLQVDFQRLTHPDDLQTDLALVQDLLAGRRSHYHLEKRYLDRDGKVIWARLSVSLVRNEHGEPLHFVSQIQDITAQRSSEQRLFESEQRSRITLDAVADLVLSVSLDGRIDYANAAALSNRRGFEVHLQQAITRVERTGQAASLMYIDLDRFKPINDTWGHLAGDAVLWAVASVLRHGVRDSDVVARLGGDEFAVILSGCTPRRAARIGGELLHTLASLSIPWDQDRLRVGASIGIAPLAGGMSVDQAVAAADAQCYRAKAMGRNNVQVQGEASELPGDDSEVVEG